MTEQAVPASAPSGPQTIFFTFGLDHPLSLRFVVLYGTRDSTRHIMLQIFGQQWAKDYNATEWDEVQYKATARGRPYTQLVLSIPGERITADTMERQKRREQVLRDFAPPQPSGTAHLVFGRDWGQIIEVAEVDSPDEGTRAFKVYTVAAS